MRFVKYLFLAVLGLILFILALANRDIVTLRLVSDDVAGVLDLPNRVNLPLFAVIFAALVAGILVGLVWEWFREHQYRAESARRQRETEALRRDLSRLAPTHEDGSADEVLTLLEKGR